MLTDIFEWGVFLLLLLLVSTPFGYLMAHSLIKANKFVDTGISLMYGAAIGISLILARMFFLPADREETYILGTVIGVISYLLAYYFYYRRYKNKYKLKISLFRFMWRMAKQSKGKSYSEGLEGAVEQWLNSGEELSGPVDIWLAWILSGFACVLLAGGLSIFASFGELFAFFQILFKQNSEFRWLVIILAGILLLAGIAQIIPSSDK